MKFLVITSSTSYFIKFRLDLVKEIINKGNEIVVISPDNDENNILKKLNIKLITTNLNKTSLSFLNSFKYFLDLIKIIKKEKPDKVFAYTIKPVIFGSIASKISKVPENYSMITGLGYVYSNDTFKFKLLQFIAGTGYKLAFTFSKKVIFQNQDDINEFVYQRKYLDINKCELVNGSGVNMKKYPKHDLPNNISFLMVSRILSFKGIEEYFKAAKIVKEKYPNIEFVYVGSSDNSPLSIDIINKYSNYIDSGIVNFYKNVPQVQEFLNNCTIFVLPSYYREGIPRALLEALSVGRPIITTNSIGCKEVINNNKNGFLVTPKDENDLANKMIYFIENQNLIPQMAEESYQYCQTKFDVNIINKQLLNILNIK